MARVGRWKKIEKMSLVGGPAGVTWGRRGVLQTSRYWPAGRHRQPNFAVMHDNAHDVVGCDPLPRGDPLGGGNSVVAARPV